MKKPSSFLLSTTAIAQIFFISYTAAQADVDAAQKNTPLLNSLARVCNDPTLNKKPVLCSEYKDKKAIQNSEDHDSQAGTDERGLLPEADFPDVIADAPPPDVIADAPPPDVIADAPPPDVIADAPPPDSEIFDTPAPDIIN